MTTTVIRRYVTRSQNRASSGRIRLPPVSQSTKLPPIRHQSLQSHSNPFWRSMFGIKMPKLSCESQRSTGRSSMEGSQLSCIIKRTFWRLPSSVDPPTRPSTDVATSPGHQWNRPLEPNGLAAPWPRIPLRQLGASKKDRTTPDQSKVLAMQKSDLLADEFPSLPCLTSPSSRSKFSC